ncbi:uncharacterized protein BDV14DRAFT_89446 [Aspergillus stella-maris]|uniref:uncharacterized protein n=1 Tax=Aspergillus stella-maris TaxID=1810926 RepID=UPI003CCD4EBF
MDTGLLTAYFYILSFFIFRFVIITCLALFLEGMGLALLFGVNGETFSRRDDYEAPRISSGRYPESTLSLATSDILIVFSFPIYCTFRPLRL